MPECNVRNVPNISSFENTVGAQFSRMTNAKRIVAGLNHIRRAKSRMGLKEESGSDSDNEWEQIAKSVNPVSRPQVRAAFRKKRRVKRVAAMLKKLTMQCKHCPLLAGCTSCTRRHSHEDA